jgi:hypothetical protein
MNSNPMIESYFYKGDPHLEQEYVLEGDTLWIRVEESLDTVYEKTMKAFAYFAGRLNTYDFVFRPNLSSFVVFDRYIDYCSTLATRGHVSAVIGREGEHTFPSGSGFTMSSDVVLKLLRDNPPLVVMDDVTIGVWLHTSGIPIRNAGRCDYTNGTGLPTGADENTTFHYRVKNPMRGLDITIHKMLYDKFYK